MLPVVPEAAVLEAVAAPETPSGLFPPCWALPLFISALAAGGDSLAGMAAYVGSYLLIGWDVLKAAFLGMMRGRAINENFLMSIASLGAMFLGDYSEAVGVMLFYRVGEYLQERAVAAPAGP